MTTAPLVSRPRLITETFPVTILFALQYGALVVFPAVTHDTPPLSLIITICAVGTGTAFVVEAIRAPLGRRNVRPIPISPRAAMWIVGIGWVASIGGAITGGVAYANQTTRADPSHLAAVFTPLTSWLVIGAVLVMAQAAQGTVSRKRAWWVIGSGFALDLTLSLRDALLSNAVSYFFVVTFLAVVLGFIRWRWVIVALFAIPIVLPSLYNLKTQERTTISAIAQPGQKLNYGDRLRLDREMAQVEDFPSIPTRNISVPSLPTLLLFGLVPRAFDQSRGTLNTGENLSAAVGGSPTSSDTATAFGNAYIINGWPGVILYSGLCALAAGMIVRRRGPWAFALLGVIAQTCLLVEESYPDMLAGLLQGCVSWAVALLSVQILSRKAAPVSEVADQEAGSGNEARPGPGTGQGLLARLLRIGRISSIGCASSSAFTATAMTSAARSTSSTPGSPSS
jgi:hypothetical protein